VGEGRGQGARGAVRVAELPYDVEQVLIGSLIGDGGLKKGKSSSYYETHSLKQSEYLKWKAEILSSFFGGNVKIRNEKDGRKFITFSTRCHPILTELRGLWYPNGKKTIPMQELQKLDKLSLAVWYQDDGYYNYEKRMCGIALGKKFRFQEPIVEDWFKGRCGLDPHIVTKIKNPCLHFSVKDSTQFLQLIVEYVHPSMIYKLGHLHPANQAKIEEKYRQGLEHSKKRNFRYYYKNRAARLQYAHRNYLAKTLDQKKTEKKREVIN